MSDTPASTKESCDSSSEPNGKWRIHVVTCILLSGFVAYTYAPVIGFDFHNYDDPQYVIYNGHVNSGLTWTGFLWAFRTDHVGWHPLTFISHMLDCELFGLDANYHHLTSLILHLVNVILVYWIALRVCRLQMAAVVVAVLFGLHPQSCEAVVWISARKDMTSTFFEIAPQHRLAREYLQQILSRK
jgi:hypothetical protein